MADPKTEHRPGNPMARWRLFEPRVQDSKEIGVHDPEGKFYSFHQNEEFVAFSLEEDHEREPYIKTTNGTLIPFDVWAEQQGEN